ncbi:MAG: MATE family efflux transporter, partial [Prevotella sp.]
MILSLSQYSSHASALIKLGLPIIIGQLGNIILGFADTLMIGHHTMPELAAASFVNSIFTLVFVFSLGFCNGITP